MKRICHVSPHLPPDQAANALLPAQLGAWMAQRGDHVTFVAHEPMQATPKGPRGASVPGLSPDAIRWIARRGKASRLTRGLRVDAWRMMRRVYAALKSVAADADLLHLHSNGLIIEAAAMWARRRKIPYVLTLYGTEIWHYRKRRPIDLFTRAYVGAARVTFYSQRLLEAALKEGLDRNGLSVVYPAVSEAFAPHSESTRESYKRALGIHERFLILNVKRLHPLAGQDYLIDAFALLTKTGRDARLVICGDGPLRGEIEERVKAFGLGDRVTLTGLLPNETVAHYMAAADMFVLPSLLEALPTVAVEALASGTPVVSADHPGGVELHGLFGSDVIVVPRESVDALARAMQELLQHPRRTRPATAQQLGARFRPPAVLQAFDEVYAKALRRSSR